MQPGGAKIVVIGGGTGSFSVLSGLKNYAKNITALVNMADDGGSTGVLRDELGVLPPGDVRQCLVALSQSPRVRELFNYRFDEGSLKGHAFGNLFLTALEKMTGSFADGVDVAGEVLKIDGKVLPITLDAVTLCLHDGQTSERGQFAMAHSKFAKKRPRVWLDPVPTLNPLAKTAISEADLIVVAPGNLYGSLAPTLVVPGVGEALAKTSAKCVYICNLVTKPGQTDHFAVHDFASEVERLAGAEFLDYVIYNTNQPGKKLLERYAKAGELPVAIAERKFKTAHYRVKKGDLLATEIWSDSQAADPIGDARTYIRHDPDKLARQIMRVYFS